MPRYRSSRQFVSNLLPGYLLVGVGMALAFVAVSIAALSGVGHREAGLASGLLNTSQQVGGALGVAIAGSIALTHAKSLLHAGHGPAAASTAGYALGFWVIAGFAAVRESLWRYSPSLRAPPSNQRRRRYKPVTRLPTSSLGRPTLGGGAPNNVTSSASTR